MYCPVQPPGMSFRASGKLAPSNADVAQLVAHHLAKVRVAGSNPVVRSWVGVPCSRGALTSPTRHVSGGATPRPRPGGASPPGPPATVPDRFGVLLGWFWGFGLVGFRSPGLVGSGSVVGGLGLCGPVRRGLVLRGLCLLGGLVGFLSSLVLRAWFGSGGRILLRPTGPATLRLRLMLGTMACGAFHHLGGLGGSAGRPWLWVRRPGRSGLWGSSRRCRPGRSSRWGSLRRTGIAGGSPRRSRSRPGGLPRW